MLNRITGSDFARPIVPYIGMVALVQVENVFIIEQTCYLSMSVAMVQKVRLS